MEASEPKWVNPVLNIMGINSLRLGGLHKSFSNISMITDLWSCNCLEIWDYVSRFLYFTSKLMDSSVSELTPIIFNVELTHLASEAYISCLKLRRNPYIEFLVKYQLTMREISDQLSITCAKWGIYIFLFHI